MTKKFKWEEIDWNNYKTYNAYYGKELLGEISFYDGWKKWVWEQEKGIVLSLSCNREVTKKLEELEGQDT